MDPEVEPASVAVAEFHDPAELARSLRDADVRYLSLASPGYRSRVTSVGLGPVRLQDVHDEAHVAHGAIEGGRVAILFGMHEFPDGTLVDGMAMRLNQAMVLGPGAPIHCHVPGQLHWAGLAIETTTLDQAVDERDALREGRFTMQDIDAPTWSRLTATVAEVSAVAAADPARLALPLPRKDIAETFLHLAGRALCSRRLEGGRLRALHRRVRLVADAENLMAARLGTPIYSEDVCAGLGVPIRTLHDAFVAVHGMSLHKYLRLRRLNQVREALSGKGLRVRQVKAAALDAGFWHLGRFAREYRALFGEAPSETLEHRQAG